MKRYEKARTGRAVWQLINSSVPYFGLWAVMVVMVRTSVPYVFTLGVAIVASLFLVRLFVLFHDTCHGSLFSTRRANVAVGRVVGALAFSCFDEFRYSHGVHHATVGDLDRRGVGDVWTMTVAEYQAAPRMTRLGYRMYRHPLVLFVLGPIFIFLVRNRFPTPGADVKRFWSVIFTDLGIAALAVLISLAFGWQTYLMIQLPVMLIAGAVGIWLFYVQHQFDPAYWAHHEEWGSVDAALIGSSHYKLPRVLQWVTANIGLHHIHHLRPRIPNYNLVTCLEEVPEVQLENPLTVGRSIRSINMNLWDEANQALISFRRLRKRSLAPV
jgi:omega-6 fatty acid desaturase (delta-12 desaturase)